MRLRRGQLDLALRTWGGRRRGAGRKPGPGRRMVPHRPRAAHVSRYPVHVTLRGAAGLPSLRQGGVFVALRAALAASCSATFRLLHYSVQANHLHLVVEAEQGRALARGLQGLAIRTAKAVNRALGCRGRLWGDRYHARALTTPREVRNALVYVLNNVRKHVRGVRGLDPCSSAAWFTGWRAGGRVPVAASPLAAARTWLARVGWLRHGRIHLDETPRGAP